MAFVAMGAGPCDIIDTDDSSSNDAVDDQCKTTYSTCNHSLELHVLLAGGEAYPEGTYSFSVTAPDESVYVLDCYLPRADAGMECSGGNVDSLVAWIDVQDFSVMHLHVVGAPPYCTIEVLRNGEILIQKTIEPDYDDIAPNGEGCEPICFSGEEYMAVAIY